MPEKKEIKIITTHHEAHRDYFIIETYEAGMVLVGCEVKSLRESKASLAGSFARFEGAAVVREISSLPPVLLTISTVFSALLRRSAAGSLDAPRVTSGPAEYVSAAGRKSPKLKPLSRRRM